MSEARSDQPEDGPTENLEDLYENAPCGYLSLRADGRIFKVNATLATWTGFPANVLVGKRLPELLSFGTRIFFETNVAPLLRLQGFFEEAPLDLITPSGERLPILANAVERRDEAGRHLFTRLTVFKAAERRRYERQIVEARDASDVARTEIEALEAATQRLLDTERETAQLREQFIAVLGHDLRNPLASIKSGANLLAKEVATERGTRILGLMQGSVDRMSALIDDVLDFARGRLGGGIPLSRRSDVSLVPVLEQIVAELRVGEQDREIVADFDLPGRIDCDPTRIGQLVSNLVGNAITHGSRDEPVRIHAAVFCEEMELRVENGGKPIPPEVMGRLFQPFFRGEARASRQGLGLGLHIAFEIAKAHGGTLTVDSEEAETRFTFRMPLSGSDPSP
ncbi:MAG: PAS domain-containing sensor histidine kinase [Janthinobacterium lividum]